MVEDVGWRMDVEDKGWRITGDGWGDGCIVYLICIEKINPIGDQSFHKYRRLPTSTLFWFGLIIVMIVVIVTGENRVNS